jgi:hypothetical protein
MRRHSQQLEESAHPKRKSCNAYAMIDDIARSQLDEWRGMVAFGHKTKASNA